MHGSQGSAFVARETVASLLEEERLHAYAPLVVDEEGYAFVEDLVAALADGEDMFQLLTRCAMKSPGACPYNQTCAQQYVGKSQSCMVISGRLIVHAPAEEQRFLKAITDRREAASSQHHMKMEHGVDAQQLRHQENVDDDNEIQDYSSSFLKFDYTTDGSSSSGGESTHSSSPASSIYSVVGNELTGGGGENSSDDGCVSR